MATAAELAAKKGTNNPPAGYGYCPVCNSYFFDHSQAHELPKLEPFIGSFDPRLLETDEEQIDHLTADLAHARARITDLTTSHDELLSCLKAMVKDKPVDLEVWFEWAEDAISRALTVGAAPVPADRPEN